MKQVLNNAHLFYQFDKSKSSLNSNEDLVNRPRWKYEPKTDNLKPTSDLYVTHVNHTAHLNNSEKYTSILASNKQSSKEWLETNSLNYMKLSLKDLVEKGTKNKVNCGKNNHLVFNYVDIMEFEYKLNEAIEMYHKRIKWLLQGSKKKFGQIQGKRVAVLMDSSDDNIGFGRVDRVQQDLLSLVDEQLKHKKGLHFMSVGTEPLCLWSRLRDVNKRTLEEAKDFIKGLHPDGGCNLLKSMRKALKLKHVDCIVVVLGSCCDQTSWHFLDFVEQALLGRSTKIHTVAYETTNQLTCDVLKKLAIISKGTFHCYSSSDDKQVYKSFDVQLLLRQAQVAIDVLNKITQMREGRLGDALVSIENEISQEIEALPGFRFLPRPVNHHQKLQINHSKVNYMNSKQWLKNNGLATKNLVVYQVLAPNAFDPIKDFVAVLGKSVQSSIHEKAMQQIVWHDGKIKNVHVDVPTLHEYQVCLGTEVNRYEKRIDWLSSESRKIWGNICENSVVIILDTSITNTQYIVHLQHSVRLCLQEQISNKKAFNIIAYGSHPKMWRSRMVEPTSKNLQSAWKWVLELKADGSRNFLSAFKCAVENDLENMGNVEGVYLLTSGVQDQQQVFLSSFVEETSMKMGVKLNTILFNIDDRNIDENHQPGRYATVTECCDYLRDIAHASNGRFHWFDQTGILESDDIYLLTKEIEKAVEYSKMCSDLVQKVIDKDNERRMVKENQLMLENGEYTKKMKTEIVRSLVDISEPKHTQLTQARLDLSRNCNSSKENSNWKVSRRNPGLPQSPYKADRPGSAKSNKNSNKRVKVNTQKFYINQKSNNVGAVFTGSLKQKSVRKSIPEVIFPQREERITSKQWMRKYSLNKMKMNLNKLLNMAACKHGMANSITSKWFSDLFPSAQFSGEIRHIDLRKFEVELYEQQLTRCLKRYLSRLQWLLSGSRNYFGTIVENNVAILVDTSGSMVDNMVDLQKQLSLLIWQQLHKNNIKFNMLSFSNVVTSWQNELVDGSDVSACKDAVHWIESLNAHGGTNTIQAIKEAHSMKNVDAIYYISDGKPDTSCKLTIEEVKKLNEDKKIPVHCISYKTVNESCDKFLMDLSLATGGRYHCCQGDSDAQLAIHKINSIMTSQDHDENDPVLPDFSGDDLKRVVKEINKCRQFFTTSKKIKEIISNYESSKLKQTEEESTKDPRKPFLPY